MAKSEITVDIVAKVHPVRMQVTLWFIRLLHCMGADIDVNRAAQFIVRRCMTIKLKSNG